jgi:hypothetical protein
LGQKCASQKRLGEKGAQASTVHLIGKHHLTIRAMKLEPDRAGTGVSGQR